MPVSLKVASQAPERTPPPDRAKVPTGERGRDEKRTGTEDAARPIGLGHFKIVSGADTAPLTRSRKIETLTERGKNGD